MAIKILKRTSKLDIAELINEKFGFSPKVLLLTPDMFHKAISNCPYMFVDGKESEGKAVHFYFCSSAPEMNLETQKQLEQLCADSEQYTLIDSVFYLYAPKGIGRSKLAAKAESILGVDTTARNLNTVRKLLAMI